MRNNNVNNVVTRRYKIASGHLKKVIRMIENGDYCIDIIHQSLAVQAALRKADDLVLKNHLETCVSDDIKKGNSKKAIDEVMKVLEKK
jgi:DNA-binding FrmR family transcriptional regulator